jgi:hypothetical protein
VHSPDASLQQLEQQLHLTSGLGSAQSAQKFEIVQKLLDTWGQNISSNVPVRLLLWIHNLSVLHKMDRSYASESLEKKERETPTIVLIK